MGLGGDEGELGQRGGISRLRLWFGFPPPWRATHSASFRTGTYPQEPLKMSSMRIESKRCGSLRHASRPTASPSFNFDASVR